MPTNLNNEEVFSKNITEIVSVSSINPSDSFLVGQGSEIKKATATQVQNARSIQGRTVVIPGSGLKDNALLRYRSATNQFELVNEPELFIITDANAGSMTANVFVDVTLTKRVDRGNNFSGNRFVIPRTGYYEIWGRADVISANTSNVLNNINIDFAPDGGGPSIKFGQMFGSTNTGFTAAGSMIALLSAGVAYGFRLYASGNTGVPINYSGVSCSLREVSTT